MSTCANCIFNVSDAYTYPCATSQIHPDHVAEVTQSGSGSSEHWFPAPKELGAEAIIYKNYKQNYNINPVFIALKRSINL